MSLRPAPLLQSERSFSVSSDNGTTTPLPVPYNDFWDINTVPNAGLTQVYQITNISEYQGRVIYVNKTQNTAGGTVRLSLPGGYTFSSTGTQNYDFPDAPTQLIISISTSSVVAIQTGGSGVGPNSTLINWQVPDLNLGTGNVISVISDTNGNNYIDTVTGGDLTLSSANDYISSANGTMSFQASQGYTMTLAPVKTLSITGTTGIVSVATANINLPNLASVSTNNIVNFNSGTGRISFAPRFVAANTVTSNLASNANGNFANSITVPANTITATGQSLRFQGDYRISKTSGAPVGTIFAYGLTTALPPLGTSPSGCFSNFAAGWTVGPANITDYSMTYDCTVTCATLAVSPALSTFRVHEVINICDNDGSSPSYPAQTYVFSQGSAFQMDVGAANIFTGNISANAGSNTSFTCYLQKVWFE